MTTLIKEVFFIAKLDEEGNWKPLKQFDTYEDADDAFDEYCDRYPFAHIDIISPMTHAM
jgi:hypothetical protein